MDASNPGTYIVTRSLTNCTGTATQEVLIMNGNNCNTINFNTTKDAIDNGGNNFQLTPAQNDKVGAIWCQSPLNLNYPFNISCQLDFGSDVNGADGIAFVMQESSNTLAHQGGGIGYAVGGSNQNPGFNPSFAIEFDTYHNSIDAPASSSNDHMAIQLNGDLDHSSLNSNSLITPINLVEIETPTAHSLVISWDPNPDNNLTTTEGELKVYFDNQLLIPSGITGQYTLLRDVKSDFDPSNNGMVYWGFTAATGGANNAQEVLFQNASFWSGNDPVTLSDNTNVWQGDITAPTETIIDPIDNSILHHTTSWFNPCNWSASFVPDYDTDVVIPHPTSNASYHHPIVNYNTSVFSNHSVLNFDMDRDGDIDSDDQVQGKGFAKSLKLEGDGLFFIKTNEGAEIQVKD